MAELLPPVPESLAETGLSFQFLADLALKTAALESSISSATVAERMRLPLLLAEELMQHLYHEKLVEIRAALGFNNHRYALLDRGWEQLKRLQEFCSYVGPAPVSLTAYSVMVRSQAQPPEVVETEKVAATFADLVLPESLLRILGCVVNSRRSLLISGAPGTGKTAIAERINEALAGAIWIPYAIAVDDQVINIYDPHHHQLTFDEENYESHDQRWLRIRRPLIIVGGEMTIESTELAYHPAAHYYEAPFQIKANGGTLVIDDFGRQRIALEALLNRWIVPLERRLDFLTLHTGKKLAFPFEPLIIFSTNLEVEKLADEAFLRRIGYRVRLSPPDEQTYRQIFARCARDLGITYEPAVLDYLVAKYQIEQRTMKACEPRDLLTRFLDLCHYQRLTPILSCELLDQAWAGYFGVTYTAPEKGA